MKTIIIFVLTISTMLLSNYPVIAQQSEPPWPMFRHDLRQTCQSNFEGPDNPNAKLIFKGSYFSYPLIGANGTIYLSSNTLSAISSDGMLLWKFDTEALTYYSAMDNLGNIYVPGESNNSYYFYKFNFDNTSSKKFNSMFKVDIVTPGNDNVIYIESKNSKLNNCFYAINQNGTEKWHFDLPDDRGMSSPSIANDGTIYITQGSILYALDNNGKLLWQYSGAGHNIDTPVIGSDNTLYTGCYDCYCYAIRSNGSLKWRRFLETPIYQPSISSKDETIYFPTTILLSTNKAYLLAYDSNGNLKWKLENDYPFNTPAIDRNGILYTVSNDIVYAFYPTGSLKWKIEFDKSLNIANVIIGDNKRLYVNTSKGSLYLLEDEYKPSETIVSIYTTQPVFKAGDNLKIEAKIDNAENESIDFYAAVLIDGRIYFYPGWNNELVPTGVDKATSVTKEILNIVLTENTTAGQFTFFAMITKHNTFDLIGFDNITVQIE